jgi:transglutaminase-like putative cysteine protease
MRLNVRLETVHEFPQLVTNSVNEAWLRPLTDERQSCLAFRLTTTPPSDPRPYTDYFGNTVYHFDVHAPHDRLAIVAAAEVQIEPWDVEAALLADSSPMQPLSAEAGERWLDFLTPTSLTCADAEVRRLVSEVGQERATLSSFLLKLLAGVHEQAGLLDAGPGSATPALGPGPARDGLHCFLAACRLVGVPARYTAGYLCDERAGTRTHAWAEALLPSAGWVGLDPAIGRPVGDQHVRIAVGRDYEDVPPIRSASTAAAASGAMPVAAQEAQQQQ